MVAGIWLILFYIINGISFSLHPRIPLKKFNFSVNIKITPVAAATLFRWMMIDAGKSTESLYGYEAVKNWYNEFNRGRRLLKDEFREGRPKTAVVSENIDAVRELIMQDRHVTYLQIEDA